MGARLRGHPTDYQVMEPLRRRGRCSAAIGGRSGHEERLRRERHVGAIAIVRGNHDAVRDPVARRTSRRRGVLVRCGRSGHRCRWPVTPVHRDGLRHVTADTDDGGEVVALALAERERRVVLYRTRRSCADTVHDRVRCNARLSRDVHRHVHGLVVVLGLLLLLILARHGNALAVVDRRLVALTYDLRLLLRDAFALDVDDRVRRLHVLRHAVDRAYCLWRRYRSGYRCRCRRGWDCRRRCRLDEHHLGVRLGLRVRDNFRLALREDRAADVIPAIPLFERLVENTGRRLLLQRNRLAIGRGLVDLDRPVGLIDLRLNGLDLGRLGADNLGVADRMHGLADDDRQHVLVRVQQQAGVRSVLRTLARRVLAERVPLRGNHVRGLVAFEERKDILVSRHEPVGDQMRLEAGQELRPSRCLVVRDGLSLVAEARPAERERVACDREERPDHKDQDAEIAHGAHLSTSFR